MVPDGTVSIIMRSLPCCFSHPLFLIVGKESAWDNELCHNRLQNILVLFRCIIHQHGGICHPFADQIHASAILLPYLLGAPGCYFSASAGWCRGEGDGVSRAWERNAQSFCLEHCTPVRITFPLAPGENAAPNNPLVTVLRFSLA